MKKRNIGIVGMGLIGGSLAKAISSRTPHTVFGFDKDPEVLYRAAKERCIDDALSDSRLPSIDILILALYPAASIDYLQTHAPHLSPNTIVTDCCGVKRRVAEKIAPIAVKYGLRYVGGHPMAGKERSGFCASDATLFAGASMILCRDEKTEDQAYRTLMELYLALGFCRVQTSTPEKHDRMIAYTSQLAHLVSSAYVKSAAAKEQQGYSAGSFRDMTRVARLNPDLWTELFLENQDGLIAETEAFIQRLTAYCDALRDSDAGRLHALLAEGDAIKRAIEQEEAVKA